MNKIAIIGNYPPRQCGIATFTKDLNEGFKEIGVTTAIVAMNDGLNQYDYPDDVVFEVEQNVMASYIYAAQYLNANSFDAVILQHEFGIFGGKDGVHILPLLHQLKMPLVVTLHTVLQTPSYAQKEILQRICKMANRVVVMSRKATEMLTGIYGVPKSKIALVEHGVPAYRYIQEEAKREFRLQDKKVLLTFGFVSRNKGIEIAIKAMSEVVKKHPDILYIVLGKTHPAVLRHVGEEYRLYLTQLIEDLNLEENVILLNEFTTQKELFKYLYASDIYITPYLNEQQVTSGTLTYAVGAGSAVVSTPYWHAAELLSNGRGVLFDFGDTNELSRILTDLLDNPEKRLEIRKKALDYGKKISWPKIGSVYNDVIETVVEKDSKIEKKGPIPFDISLLPAYSIEYIKRLTDDFGIIQHGFFGIPNLKEGYCLDDNSRALLVALMAYKVKKDTSALRLCSIYLSYIHYMQNEDGRFRNLISFNRQFPEEVGSEDSFGRTIWALGYMMSNAPDDSYYQSSKHMFFKAMPHFEKLRSVRSIANTMIGISYYLQNHMSDDMMIEKLKQAGRFFNKGIRAELSRQVELV